MSTYIVAFTISEEIRVDAPDEDAAVFRVKEALRAGTYPLNVEKTFIHAKDVDDIKWLGMSDLAQHPQTLMEVLTEPDDGKEPCPECGKRFVPGPGMGVHRHSAHGNASRRKRRDAGVKRERRPALPPVTADDVFDAVVNQLYPRGVIPVAALAPLLRWRHATDEMLEAIR